MARCVKAPTGVAAAPWGEGGPQAVVLGHRNLFRGQ